MCGQLFLHHVLTVDARVVFAWQVEGLVAAHALVAYQDVLHAFGESMSHVQHPRHIGRGHDDGVRLLVGVAPRREVALRLPPVVPVGLYLLMTVGFGHLG